MFKGFKSFSSVLVFVLSFQVFAGQNYPQTPDLATTPGSLCADASSKRYSEQINYCDRDVSTDLKKSLFKIYDEQLGFHIRTMNRGDFKIDHFIPLSIGGSNNRDNLWPQHKSVYNVTDPLEHLLFEKLSTGRIKQTEAIQIIRDAKLNLGRVPELIHYVERL